jgi:hypothetical protein
MVDYPEEFEKEVPKEKGEKQTENDQSKEVDQTNDEINQQNT